MVRAHERGGFGRQRKRGSGRVVGAMLTASVVVLTLDASGQAQAPFSLARDVVGDVVGPVESATAVATRPLREAAGYMSSNRDLRDEVATLSSENSRLRAQADQLPLDRNRLAELDGLMTKANETGYSLVAARVVAMGPMQSFSRTVTIDAGSSSGLRRDMTVLNNDGLVGRVVEVTRSTATVLLVVDTESVVGARLGSNQEIGFLRGRGVTDARSRLDLDLADNTVTPAKGDVVVTWGSQGGRPYVSGIPIGTVESVFSTPRELSKQAVIDPYVDFTSLDVVGVVVPGDTEGDRVVLNGTKGER
ncbi:rod shape-determining protein MreC [Nocardioides marmoraquaticus]